MSRRIVIVFTLALFVTFTATSARSAPAPLREGDTVTLDDSSPEHVVLLDADADGLADVVAIDAAGDALVFPQRLEGGFGDAQPLVLGAGVVDAIACDVDGDTREDLVAARVEEVAGGELVVSLAGDGGLGEPLRALAASTPVDVGCVGGLDDGALIAIGGDDEVVHLFRWQGVEASAPFLQGQAAVAVTSLGGLAVGVAEGFAAPVVVVTDATATSDNVRAYTVGAVGLTAALTWTTEGGHPPSRVIIADLDGGDGGEVLVLVEGEADDAGVASDSLQLLSAAGTVTSVETTPGASALAVGDAWVYSASLGLADVVVVSDEAAGLGLHERTASSLDDGSPPLCTSGCGTWSAAPSASPAAVAVGALYERCAADIVVAVPSEGVVIVPANGPEGPYALSGVVTRDGVPVVGATLSFTPGGESATTDAAGAYTVDLARTGRHGVVVEDSDASALETSVEVTCEPNEADFALPPDALPDAGAPLEDAGEPDPDVTPAADAGSERPADAGDEDPIAPAGDAGETGPSDGGVQPVNEGCACGASDHEEGAGAFVLGLLAIAASLCRRRALTR